MTFLLANSKETKEIPTMNCVSTMPLHRLPIKPISRILDFLPYSSIPNLIKAFVVLGLKDQENLKFLLLVKQIHQKRNPIDLFYWLSTLVIYRSEEDFINLPIRRDEYPDFLFVFTKLGNHPGSFAIASEKLYSLFKDCMSELLDRFDQTPDFLIEEIKIYFPELIVKVKAEKSVMSDALMHVIFLIYPFNPPRGEIIAFDDLIEMTNPFIMMDEILPIYQMASTHLLPIHQKKIALMLIKSRNQSDAVFFGSEIEKLIKSTSTNVIQKIIRKIKN